MVFLNIKGSEDQQFLLDLPVSSPTSEAIAIAVGNWNLRVTVLRLRATAGRVLSAHKKPEAVTAGCSEALQEADLSSLAQLSLSGLSPEQADSLQRCSDEAAAYVHKDQVAKRVCLTELLLQEHIEKLREKLREVLLSASLTDKQINQLFEQMEAQELDPADADMWFTGKVLSRTGKLSDRLGSNNKSKVVVRLQQSGLGAPAREAGVDAATQQAMLAYYHKRQETEQRLAADDMDYNSPWADPRSLKQTFSGLGAVRLK
ncbi:hypothetical protein WJX73_008281 [Symbiochloris irregularis]|uniref:Uncharacterized protein n=1 Tax=Symbiochloris irregularis TaxID=706552 RepID=A0AAW1PN37_9CHLO